MNLQFKNKKVLCFGTSPGQRKQCFLQEATINGGIEFTILKFPGETYLVDYPFRTVEVSWDNLEKDLGCLTGEIFDSAVTYDEMHVLNLSDCVNYLQLKRRPLSKEIALKCRDKREMKKTFFEHQIPTADFGFWSTKSELEKKVSHLGLCGRDYVLKPALGAASAGVLHVHSNETVELALIKFEELCREGAKKAGYLPIVEPPFIVERYIDRFGIPVELAVDGYVANSSVVAVMVSEKIDMVRSGLFLENKYVTPPLSDFVTRDLQRIEDIAKRAVGTLGINDSVYHLEMRYDNNDLKVLEVGSRPGGGLISESCEITTSVNLREQHLCLSLGLEPQLSIKRNNSTCFGTVYYQEGFDVDNLGRAIEHLNQVNAFCEFRADPQSRKHILHDWLIAFGVTGRDSKDSYKRFYHAQEKVYHILRHG